MAAPIPDESKEGSVAFALLPNVEVSEHWRVHAGAPALGASAGAGGADPRPALRRGRPGQLRGAGLPSPVLLSGGLASVRHRGMGAVVAGQSWAGGGISLPGVRVPAGASGALTPRSTSGPRTPISPVLPSAGGPPLRARSVRGTPPPY